MGHSPNVPHYSFNPDILPLYTYGLIITLVNLSISKIGYEILNLTVMLQINPSIDSQINR
jgi:hypothetical protein